MKNLITLLFLAFLVTNQSYSQCTPSFNFYQYSCQYDCGLYLNNLPYDPELNYEQAVSWDFGDGTYEVGDHFATQHQYNSPGTYIVTAQILVGECNGQMYTYEMVVEDCNCPTEITTTLSDSIWNEGYSSQCSYYQFTFGGEDFVYFGGVTNTTVSWDFGDGNTHVGQSPNIGHGYLSEGEFIVTAVFSNDYCVSVTHVDTVNVSFCDESCLPTEYFDYYQVPGNCNNVNLVLDYNPNTDWYVNGEYVGTGYSAEAYLEEGDHEVCMVLDPTEGCPLGSDYCTTITIECESECPTDQDLIGYNIQEECNLWEFFIEGIEQDATIIWDFGDGETASNSNYALHLYAEDGEYLVTATYYSEDCPNGQVVLTYLVETQCIDECEIYVEIYEEETCLTGLFAETNAEGTVAWYIDGEYAGSGLTMYYNTPGYHEYCAIFASGECNYVVEYCGEFMVQCEQDCPTEITTTQLACDTYMFEVITAEFDEIEQITWGVNGSLISYDEILTYTFEEGLHTIGAMVETALCYEELYINVVVEDCDDACTTVDFTIDSFVNQGGPPSVSWMVYNVDEPSIGESGLCEFDSQSMYCDPAVCLPDGCYEMVLFVNEGFDWNSFTSYPSINGDPLNIYDITEDCNCGIFTYNFSINGDCGEEECYLDIQSVNLGATVYGFNANAPAGVDVTWTMGDGTSLTGTAINYEYTTPGTYEVCAFYVSANCPEGVESCTTVIVEEDVCTAVTISIEANIGDQEFELLQFYLQNEGFDFEGEIPMTSLNGSIAMTYCIPDGCYDFTLVPADGLFDLVNLSVEASINGVVIASLDQIIGTEPVTITIPVNTVCTSSVSEVVATSFELFPNPANNFIQIRMNETMYDHLEIYNSIGEMVLSKELTKAESTFEVSELSSGIYQVKLSNQNAIETKSILIHR